MTNTCLICENGVRTFDRHYGDGQICAECFSCLPTVIPYKAYPLPRLMHLIDKNKHYRKIFSATASLGTVYLDTAHRLFCISRKSRNGEPAELCNIFSIDEICDISIGCENVRCVSSDGMRVLCDVQLNVRTDEISFKEKILYGERCLARKTIKGETEFNEPTVVSVFRSMWVQMATDELNRIIHHIDEYRETRNLTWARGVLMLRAGYSEEYLWKQYTHMKELHAGNEQEIQILDYAYDILHNAISYKEE